MFRGKQPRQARFDPRRHPVRLAMPLSVADRQVIEVRERLALAEVEAGRTSPQARRELLLAAGLCWSLALRGIGPEAEPLAAAALGAISRESPDASVLFAMLDALDQQRRIATRGELIDAAKDAQQLAQTVVGQAPARAD